MSKTETLKAAGVSAIVMLCTAVIGIPWLPWLCLYAGISFMLWYGYKRWKHARLLGAAWSEAHQEPPKLIATTSPGSSRLFVPQPLDRQ